MLGFFNSLRYLSLALFRFFCASCLLLSCTQDNVHMPAEETSTDTWETRTVDCPGVLATTVPLMQEYLQGTILREMTVHVDNCNTSHSGYVDVRTEAFEINDPFVTEMLGKAIEIGRMEIRDVEYAAFPTGGGYLKKDAFDVQAGEYRTRGSLYGELSSAGRLTLTLSYRPGTMPFEIVSKFETNQ